MSRARRLDNLKHSSAVAAMDCLESYFKAGMLKTEGVK